MKKIMLTMLLIAFSMNVFAGNDPEPVRSEVGKELQKLLSRPGFNLSAKELSAFVRFTINNDNEIVVIDVDADNELIEDYVKQRLNYKKINSNELQIGKDYLVKIRVKAD